MYIYVYIYIYLYIIYIEREREIGCAVQAKSAVSVASTRVVSCCNPSLRQ